MKANDKHNLALDLAVIQFAAAALELRNLGRSQAALGALIEVSAMGGRSTLDTMPGQFLRSARRLREQFGWGPTKLREAAASIEELL